MEETKKFYSQRAITIATYFGGPLAAGYLLKKNFETLEQPEFAKKSLFIGIVSTILIFGGIFSIPEEILDKIPNAAIPLVYTLIIYLIVERFQGESLKSHKESGGEFYSCFVHCSTQFKVSYSSSGSDWALDLVALI